MIQLQFVAEAALSSRIIGWYGGGGPRYLSHVDAVLPNGSLFGARSDRVGGQPAGCWARSPGYLPFSRWAVMSVPSSDAQERAFYDFLAKQRGKPYDGTAIWAFLLNRDWREDDSWICSELQTAALVGAGIFPVPYLAANKITPLALAFAVSVLPGVAISEFAAAEGRGA